MSHLGRGFDVEALSGRCECSNGCGACLSSCTAAIDWLNVIEVFVCIPLYE